MVTIDARLEPHFSVTSFFFLQTSRSSRKMSEFSAKSITFAKKSCKLVSFQKQKFGLTKMKMQYQTPTFLLCNSFFFFNPAAYIQVYFVESCQNLVRKVLILLRKVVSYNTRVNVSLGDKSLEVFQKQKFDSTEVNINHIQQATLFIEKVEKERFSDILF